MTWSIWHATCYIVNNDKTGKFMMFDRSFLASRLGIAAMASVGAMIAFNFYAATLQPTTMPGLLPNSSLSQNVLIVSLPARLA